MEVKRYKDCHGYYDYGIKDFKNTLRIFFGGNGDLYFAVNKENFKLGEIVNFEITKENYVIYNLFDTLYNDIVNCEIHKLDSFQLDYFDEEEIKEKQEQYEYWNKEEKEHGFYKDLVKNGVISWYHDDEILEEANVLNIHKEKDKYRLEFVCNSKSLSSSIDVRIRNSGSRYGYFCIIMMRFYQGLCKYDPEYHQIHMEEYLYQKRLSLK